MNTNLLTADNRERLLKNGRLSRQLSARGEATPDFLPVVKLFTPDTGFAWLLTELDPDDTDVAHGLCDLGIGCPEAGSVRISKLESLHGRIGLSVERDVRFKPTKTLSSYADEAWEHGAVIA
jgi:hypothetical protein